MIQRKKILVVDDDAPLRELLIEILQTKYEVFSAENGLEAIQKARDVQPDLILLDITMPHLDGYLTCENLRRASSTQEIPVIILTAREGSNDRIRAFKSGADDFLSKPFIPEELLIRIETKLKRHQLDHRTSSRKELIQCGNLELNTGNYEARIDGRELGLTMLEFNLLLYLVEHKGQLKSRNEILRNVWKSEEVPVRILDPHILALRKKSQGFDHQICTVYGGGYILKAASAKNSPEETSEFKPEPADS